MAMRKQIRSTGIPKIDTAVQQILEMPMRDPTVVRKLDKDFPGQVIKRNENLEVFVVGAGWNFLSCAIALVAAGARVVAYEMNTENLGIGQAGWMGTDEYLGFYNAWNQAQLMPNFTPAQLDRLPSDIRDIAEDPSHRALKEKHARLRSMGKEAYEGLHDSDKISKEEVVQAKRHILELLQASKLLQIVQKEVTIDMMTTWLEADQPVFMISGMHINLERQGFDHLIGTPGFVKEYLKGSEETEKLILKISECQRRLHSQKQADTSGEMSLPSVAIIGRGTTGLSCALDLLERVQPGLRVVCVALETSLINAQRKMSYKMIPGYVSGVVLSEDQSTLESVKVISFPEGKVQEIKSSLFIHTHNELERLGMWTSEFRGARDAITELLDEKVPINGLVRDSAIAPNDEARNIQFRINEPWEVSLNDDSVLKERIQGLIQQQDHKEVVIVVSGDNPMIKRVTWFAASLGYRGQFLQVALPDGDGNEAKLEEALEKKKCVWHDVKGRLGKDGTSFKNGKFTLGIQNWNGEFVPNVPDVDAVINATGKTSITPLINAMIEKKYIREKDGDLRSNHHTLSAHYTVFQGPYAEEIDSPSLTFQSYSNPRHTEPVGWEAAFKFAYKMSGNCT